MERNVISAKNLSAGYNKKPLWNGANFEIGQGEFVAVLGPNGSGKTTLFKLLLGLAEPLQGELKIFGRDPERGNRHIGYVPQRHAIDSEVGIEALELVHLGLVGTDWGIGISDARKKQAMDALKIVGAETLAKRQLGKLSGGELQRIFLAEAIIGNPDLLLLDEPLANLDIRRETEFVNLINNIVRSRGITALLVAHNINPLIPYLDRVIYAANGNIAIGRPGEILTSESLSALYGIPVEVLRDSQGRISVIGTEVPVFHNE